MTNKGIVKRQAFLPLVWRMCGRAFVSSYNDNVFGNAKGAAYSALLAFFPLLATSAAILVRFQAEFISDAIYNFLSEILPPGTQDLVFYYFAVRGRQPLLVPITGMLVSVWAGSGVMVSLMQGFHIAYRVPGGRPWVRERLIAILLVFSAAIPVLFASALIFFGLRAETWIVDVLGLATHGGRLRVAVMGKLLRYAISLGAIILGAMILYYFGPHRRQTWRRVWPGAVLTTILWLAATLIFSWYARNIANYNVMYGGIATVVLLLVWMYVLSIIAFVGCEFNAELEKAG
ncbi:MAG: YihY/virulence factor BrkB family protein [Bryobacteraceae bacterium]|jgi:membrane protein